MEYKCISADGHVDITWLPHDLFTSNASRGMKEKMPYVAPYVADASASSNSLNRYGEKGYEDTLMWVTKSGGQVSLANGKGKAPIAANASRYYPGEMSRLDRMAEIGFFDDAAKGIFRPATPELRIRDQDLDGIQAEVLYGILGVGNMLKEADTRAEVYRIYNEWLADFCKFDRRRFVGLASIPSHSVEEAVVEAKRAAKLGLGGLDVAFVFSMPPLWSPSWDPLWKAASDANLAVHFHTIGAPPDAPLPADLPKGLKQTARAAKSASFQMYIANILAGVILGGALERFPNLRIVLGESGIGWIPYVLQRMDFAAGEGGKYKDMPIKMRPSDYWYRQCRATFQYDPVGSLLLEQVGVENVMWGSDYPHADGVFPDSQEWIQRGFASVSSESRRKIVCENAGKFYGLIS